MSAGPVQRLRAAWRALSPEQRLAVGAALLLLAAMLLPWYQETGNAIVDGRLARIEDSKNAFQVYSFVEAAIFLVAAGVLVLMFTRGERRAFHLPGGDGTVVLAAGLWVMFLIFYRQLDKPDGREAGPINTSVGVQWGIFIAFLLGALLAYAGFRIRAAHVPEPALGAAAPPEPAARPTRRAAPDAVTGQMSFDEAPTEPARPAPPPRDDDGIPEYHPPPRRRDRG